MARTTIEQAKSSLAVYVKTAEQLGLDYSGFEFIKYPSGWGLERNGERLLIRGFRSLSAWYDILDAANESLRAILGKIEKTEREYLDAVEAAENGEVVFVGSDISANVLEKAYIRGLGITILDNGGATVVELPIRN